MHGYGLVFILTLLGWLQCYVFTTLIHSLSIIAEHISHVLPANPRGKKKEILKMRPIRATKV